MDIFIVGLKMLLIVVITTLVFMELKILLEITVINTTMEVFFLLTKETYQDGWAICKVIMITILQDGLPISVG